MKPPFRLKICGVLTDADILAVASAGGDAVGLNSYPKSVRYVQPVVARRLNLLARQLGVLGIGLFVNETVDHVLEVAELAELTTVQLHGDESVEMAAQLRRLGLGVLRAVRLPTGPIEPQQIEALVSPWEAAGCSILLDANVGGSFGGAGQRLDWASVSAWGRWRAEAKGPEAEGQAPVFALAGGLNVDSVAQAIQCSGAWAVDVASGVERARGVKDKRLIQEFCAAGGHILGM